MCIPGHWKYLHPPTITEWIKRVNRVAEMEDLVHQAHNTSTTYRKNMGLLATFPINDRICHIFLLVYLSGLQQGGKWRGRRSPYLHTSSTHVPSLSSPLTPNIYIPLFYSTLTTLKVLLVIQAWLEIETIDYPQQARAIDNSQRFFQSTHPPPFSPQMRDSGQRGKHTPIPYPGGIPYTSLLGVPQLSELLVVTLQLFHGTVRGPKTTILQALYIRTKQSTVPEELHTVPPRTPMIPGSHSFDTH